MNGVVGVVCRCDQELGIEDAHVSLENVFGSNWIHVMNDNSFMNLVSFNSKITTKISSDYIAANVTPFFGNIERLVKPTIASKCNIANAATKSKVSVSFFELLELN